MKNDRASKIKIKNIQFKSQFKKKLNINIWREDGIIKYQDGFQYYYIAKIHSSLSVLVEFEMLIDFCGKIDIYG